MYDPTTPTARSAARIARRARARRLRVVAVLAIAATSAGTLLASAVFNRTVSNGSNTFSAGTINLATTPSSTAITMSTMVPGDKVTASVNVANTGTLQMRYAVKSTTTENVLAAQLDMTIKSGVTTCDNTNFGASGTVIYTTGDLGSTTGINVIGDPTQGSQSGDRTLNAGSNENLCVQVQLPLGSSNTYQGLTTTATFDFTAEQVANNP